MIELTLVMKGTPEAYRTLEELREEGYNATVLTTESLHHALEYNPGDHNFITLRHLEQQGNLESVLCVFLLKEEEVEQVKRVIREYTHDFQKIKGFMYSRPIDDYEGSI